jgi:hypothetical protein
MRSKALIRFLNRAARFNDDLELVSVLGIAIEAGALTPEGDGRPLYEYVEAESHPRLAKAKPTAHNRQLVYGHLRKTVYSSYVKDLYEDFVDYVGEIVSSASRRGFAADVLRGEYRIQLSAADLLVCGSWDGVRDAITNALRDRLAVMGSLKTIEFLDKRLALDLDSHVVDAARVYLDLRHLLVHCDGVADESFCRRNLGLRARPGEAVRLDESVARGALTAIAALVEHIDARAVDRDALAAEDLN